jgi:ribosome-associated translation inhibitor RaiA
LHVYLTARHIELGDRVREYVQKQLIEPIQKHTSLALNSVEVQLFAESDRGFPLGCHVQIEIKGHRDLNVREIDETLFAAIDKTKARVLHSLTQLRNRILAARRHPRQHDVQRANRVFGR